MIPNELDKLAVKLVATDRGAARATVAAIRAWASNKKATSTVQKAILWAASLDAALGETTVKAGK